MAKISVKSLRAKKDRRFYKSDYAWLEAVYRNNKNRINEAYIFSPNQKKAFMMDVLQALNEQENKTKVKKIDLKKLKKKTKSKSSPTRKKMLSKILNKLSKSEVFTPAPERFKNNAINGLKKFNAYDKIKELEGDKQFHRNKLEFIGNNHYRYGSVVVYFENSPARIVIVDTSGTEYDFFR